MLDKLKMPLIMCVIFAVTVFAGIKVFSYLSYSELPVISLEGIKKDSYYANNLNVNINVNSGYKISSIAAFLDSKPVDLENSKEIGKKNVKLAFNLDTKELSQGKHDFNVVALDSSKHKNRNEETVNFYVDNSELKAAFLDMQYKVYQGHTIHAKIQSNKKLDNITALFLEKPFNFYPESEYSNVYECFIPLDCDLNPGEYILNAKVKDFVGNETNLSSKVDILEYNFPKQKGFVVERGKLEEEKEVSMSNKVLEDAIEKWVQDSPNKKLWSGKFELPIDVKKITTPFGEIRTTSEKGHYMHRAVDLLNFPKTVVWASQEGRVVIKDRFLLTGNTVVLDHGVGVFSIYCHLEDFADIEVGDLVKKGNKLGRLGMTGYANGYHLHWEIRVNNVAVNPMQWTQRNF
ncbi:MAG: Peptidase M23B [candidate division TM6 bacterium GW2011_GWF2_28_16]|nr:MAG: Peptidase M23B [candidate division TM6 bacterium GW2011_GWF2_28_16]